MDILVTYLLFFVLASLLGYVYNKLNERLDKIEKLLEKNKEK